jgi:hypothetical protein
MTFNELKEVLQTCEIPLQEWQWKEIPSKGYTVSTYPRCVVWPYVHTGLLASGGKYNLMQTIQVSVYSKNPIEPKVFELEELLIEKGINSVIYQEFDESDQVFHYYMGIDVAR